MPELPEVETIARQLHSGLKGKTICDVFMFKTGKESPAGKAFIQKVKGAKFTRVSRRAKVLIFEFDRDLIMLGHLKMTGKFLFVGKSYEPTKHDRILFVLNSGQLLWSDVRQFGYVKLVRKNDLRKHLAHLGPEPLETSFEDLARCLSRPSKRMVKAVLLDQTVIAGIGNIYADEACFRAKIRPTRKLMGLTDTDRMNLAKAIVKVLQESIKQKGTSANDYVDTNGERGGFLSFLRVYGRGGKPCRRCKEKIVKITLGGRGTHYCPSCQR